MFKKIMLIQFNQIYRVIDLAINLISMVVESVDFIPTFCFQCPLPTNLIDGLTFFQNLLALKGQISDLIFYLFNL